MTRQEIQTGRTMMKRRIKSAAVKDANGELHLGRVHDDTGVEGERGFLLNDGSFVDRKEGMIVARESGQLMDDEGSEELHSHMTMMDKYPGDMGPAHSDTNDTTKDDDISTKTVLFVCNPLFVDMATRLARDFKKVYLYVPVSGSFPTMNHGMVGYGLEGIELVDNMWDKVDDIDLYVFPDLGHAALQVQLEKMGKRVWGARYGEELEIYRDVTKELMEKEGLPVQPWKMMTGMKALREYLQAHENQHVKINKWRGVTESFFAPRYDIVAPKLDEIAAKLGAFQEVLEFIVEDDLPDCVEVGLDCYCIDGKYPKNTLCGIEVKDLGYVGEMMPYKSIPEPITRWTNTMAKYMGRAGYRGFLSNEIRIGEDKKPYMIDATCRAPCPPNELYCELYTNLSEIIWHGANGVMVEPIPAGKFGVEVVLKSAWAEKNWQQISFDPKYRKNIKLFNAVKVDNNYYIVPQDDEMIEIGAVVGWGDTLEEAIEMVKEAGETIEGYGIKFNVGPVEMAKEQIAKIEEFGISPFSIESEKEQS